MRANERQTDGDNYEGSGDGELREHRGPCVTRNRCEKEASAVARTEPSGDQDQTAAQVGSPWPSARDKECECAEQEQRNE